jgi:hypothetical protein
MTAEDTEWLRSVLEWREGAMDHSMTALMLAQCAFDMTGGRNFFYYKKFQDIKKSGKFNINILFKEP